MRGVRERPRLVAVRVLGVALVLGAGVLIGVLVDGDGGDRAKQVQLERRRAQSDRRAQQLKRTEQELNGLREQLEQAAQRVRTLTATNTRLRGELRLAKRSLRARRSR
jgi:chromosome segregation ATPase